MPLAMLAPPTTRVRYACCGLCMCAVWRVGVHECPRAHITLSKIRHLWTYDVKRLNENHYQHAMSIHSEKSTCMRMQAESTAQTAHATSSVKISSTRMQASMRHRQETEECTCSSIESWEETIYATFDEIAGQHEAPVSLSRNTRSA